MRLHPFAGMMVPNRALKRGGRLVDRSRRNLARRTQKLPILCGTSGSIIPMHQHVRIRRRTYKQLTSARRFGSQSPAPELKRSTSHVANSFAKARIKVAITIRVHV